jgi:CheY-like chemotaxis protein
MIKILDSGPLVMVDDNEGDLFYVQRCCSASNVKNPWLGFIRGSDFLEHLARVKDGEAPMPALVLLDLNMPRMTGLQVMQAIRADLFFDKLPVVCILTSSNDPRDRERATELGAAGFRTKAGSIDEYVAFFNSLLD